MRGDQPICPIPARDFNRTPEGSGLDPLLVAATTYGRLATQEQIDRVMLAAYGPDRLPGTESRHRLQMGEAKTCGMTGCDQPARSCGWCYTHCEATHRHRSCSVEGCDRPRHTRGWCGAHYMKWYRYGDPLAYAPKPERVAPTPEETVVEMREALDRLREHIDNH